MRSASTPASTSAVDPAGELVAHVGDDVVVDGELLHPVARAAPVHGDVGTRASADEPAIAGVGQAAADVVDEHRAGGERRVGDLGAHGVDADDDPGGGERRDDGQDAGAAPPPASTRPAPGPGRLAADVDEVGAVGERGRARGATAASASSHSAAVAERVGRDVDDAHHEAAVESLRAGAAGRGVPGAARDHRARG